nr:immunoglobulin heavy chain junction region [Mus musculus]
CAREIYYGNYVHFDYW